MKTAIFGASGFSREVADVALVCGAAELLYLDYDVQGGDYFGFPLVDEGRAAELAQDGWQFVIGTGDNGTRRKIHDKFPALPYINVVHPAASFGYRQREALDARRGNIVTAGVRFTNNIVPGDFGIYNLNATIGHDCILEDFINLAPGVNLSGNVHVREGAYVGTNAAVLQGRSIDDKLVIGRGSTVGAQSVVTKSVADGVIVKGIPAK